MQSIVMEQTEGQSTDERVSNVLEEAEGQSTDKRVSNVVEEAKGQSTDKRVSNVLIILVGNYNYTHCMCIQDRGHGPMPN